MCMEVIVWKRGPGWVKGLTRKKCPSLCSSAQEKTMSDSRGGGEDAAGSWSLLP